MSGWRSLVVSIALLVCFGCASDYDIGQLTQARRHMKAAPCGSTPAVNGVAGVNADPHLVYLGDWVVVSVCHLEELVKKSEAAQQPISLFIEGLESENAPVGMDLDSGTVTFILYRNAKNKEIWRQFLYDPLFDPYAKIRVSVGIHGEHPLPRAEGANLELRVQKLYVDSWTYLWLALLIAVAIVLVIAARRTDMLRDGPSVGAIRQPYSLGHSQMAWWFFLILFAYVYIWLVTGDRDSIPVSLLALLGISAATALAAVAVTSPSRQSAQQKWIEESIARVDAALAQSGPEGRAELEATRAKLVSDRASIAVVPRSRGWWSDLVTDERGVIALDRLQVVVWTIVLGGVFLTSVVWDLTMPELNGTLLALMGISSGTYIGFKLPLRSSEP